MPRAAAFREVPMIATGGPRNSQPGTLNQLFFEAVERYHKPDALQVKVERRYRADLAPHAVRPAYATPRSGLAELGRSTTAIGSPSCREPAGVGDRRLRLSCARRHRRPDLSERDAGGCGVHHSTIPAPWRPSSPRPSRRQDRRGARSSCPALRHVIGFSDAACAGRGPHAAGVRSAGRRRADAGARRRIPARRPGRRARTTWPRSSTPRARRASPRA